MKAKYKSFKILLILSLIILANSCEENFYNYKDCNLKTTFTDSSDIILYSDETLINFSLSDMKYPQGFYKENLDGGSIYYENTISIKPSGERPDTLIYLCTNDSSQAFLWSELSNKYGYYRKFVSSSQNEKYFQFKRVDTTNSHHIYHRTNKCSYLNRSMYDALRPTNNIGVFNKRPIDEINVKELVEYLWFISNYNFAYTNVLFTRMEQNATEFIYKIYSTHYSTGDWNLCSTIQVHSENYTVNKNNGNITYNKLLIRELTD